MLSWRFTRTALFGSLFATLLMVSPLRAAQQPQTAGPSVSSSHFYLKDGDRVCFYGDSITEQRFYPAEVQTYVLTRFPHLKVRYVDAGVGGDRVTGGWAGGIDLRLQRDVYPFHPNVVTIMLGMNDAEYQPFNEKIFDVYKQGYVHIIESLQKNLPGVRIVLIETSPYDEMGFTGGYNAVLDRYDAYVKELSQRYHLPNVDFNTYMNRILNEGYQVNRGLARQFFPGFIHPSAAGEMMMAQELLKAWGAPATVTDVGLEVSGSAVSVERQVNSAVTGLELTKGVLRWRQLDGALPMPVLGLHADWPQFPKWTIFLPPQPKPDYTNPVAALIDKLSGFTKQLDQETLKVSGLSAPEYELSIDGEKIGTFSAGDLASGINLAKYFTPMLKQAYDVQNLVWEETQVHFEGWHGVQTTMGNFGWHKPGLPVTTENDAAAEAAVLEVMHGISDLQTAIAEREMVVNQPKPHEYELAPVAASGGMPMGPM